MMPDAHQFAKMSGENLRMNKERGKHFGIGGST
jgi:hypothetical protein